MLFCTYNNDVQVLNTFAGNARRSMKSSTAFLKGNPWVRALYPARAAFNTRIVKIKPGIHKCKQVSENKIKTENKFTDFREACMVLNADALAEKLFRGF
jgi:hypothetical protein